MVVWNSSIFSGTVIDKQRFGLTVSFTSVHNADMWKLTTVYGPEPARSDFLSWFRNHTIDLDVNWIFIGDFNFYRSLENRNRPGGNLHDTILFNDAIGHLGLVELPPKGGAFTWSNMQQVPLLEQLDWFLTSVNWTNAYPSTEIIPLAKATSDHVPCKIIIGTSIPKTNIFRFENYWAEHGDFLSIVESSWGQFQYPDNPARCLAGKFKRLRHKLQSWCQSLSNMKQLADNCNIVILHLEF